MATAKKDLTDPRVQGRPHPNLLTVEQVADRLNVSVTYVRRRLIFERRIPYIKIGRKVRVDEADVAQLIDRGRVTPKDYSHERISRAAVPHKRGRARARR